MVKSAENINLFKELINLATGILLDNLDSYFSVIKGAPVYNPIASLTDLFCIREVLGGELYFMSRVAPATFASRQKSIQKLCLLGSRHVGYSFSIVLGISLTSECLFHHLSFFNSSEMFVILRCSFLFEKNSPTVVHLALYANLHYTH